MKNSSVPDKPREDFLTHQRQEILPGLGRGVAELNEGGMIYGSK